MATVEPHKPDPGYMLRWAKQSLSLMTRSPLTIVIYIAGLVISGIIASIPLSLLLSADVPAFLIYSLIYAVPAITLLPIIILVTARMFHIDTGTGPNFADGKRALLLTFKRAFLIIFILNFILSFFLSPDSIPETAQKTTAIDEDSLLSILIQIGVIMGSAGMTSYFTFLIWSEILLIPFILGVGGDMEQSKLFDDKLGKVDITIKGKLFLLILVPVFLSIYFPIFGIALSYYVIIFHYVAARELIGGIKENGKETVKATNALPQSS